VWSSLLRHCARSKKVAGSIPLCVNRIFLWTILPGGTVALGLIQIPTVMSTGNISFGVSSDNVNTIMFWLSKSGSLNLPEPSRPIQACNGNSFLFALYIGVCFFSKCLLQLYMHICMVGKVKVKTLWSGVTKELGTNIDLLLHDSGTRWSECSAARPGRTLALGNTRYPFYTMLKGPQLGLEGLNISFARGFDSDPPSPCSDAIPNELYGTHPKRICIYVSASIFWRD